MELPEILKGNVRRALVAAGLLFGPAAAAGQTPALPAIPVLPAGAETLPGASPAFPMAEAPLFPPSPLEVAAAGPTPASAAPPGTALDAAAVKALIAADRKEQEEKRRADEEGKKKEAVEKGHEVGSDLKLNAIWDNGLLFQTADKDWRFHVGGRFQYETVLFQQPGSLRGPPPGNGGIPSSTRGAGVGVLDDGMFFRRVRLRSDGVGYETFEYVLEVNFEQLNFVTYDHMWFGVKDESLGTLRVGQHKVPQAMEEIGSDYHLTFLERSSLSDAFYTLFGQGVWYSNNFLDKSVSFQTMFHRVQPTGFYTSDFGDGNYAETTRLTWTPVYKDDGAAVVHVGNSYQFRTGDLGRSVQPGGTGSAFLDTQNTARFRARPELRDATGIGAGGNLGGDPGRFVDTGFLKVQDVHTVSPEFLLILGGFSVQSDTAFAYATKAQSLDAAGTRLTPRGTPMFWGTYVEASYILTGEHRGYDRRFGTYDRIKVGENAFLNRGEDGRLHFGTGAWQVGYRYSYLDLNDNGINGGQLGQHTAVLNWYMNDNAKIQFQYSNINRNVIAPANSGRVQGLGILAQWYF